MGIRAFQQQNVKMKSKLYIHSFHPYFFSPFFLPYHIFSAFIFLTLVHNDTY